MGKHKAVISTSPINNMATIDRFVARAEGALNSKIDLVERRISEVRIDLGGHLLLQTPLASASYNTRSPLQVRTPDMLPSALSPPFQRIDTQSELVVELVVKRKKQTAKETLPSVAQPQGCTKFQSSGNHAGRTETPSLVNSDTIVSIAECLRGIIEDDLKILKQSRMDCINAR